MTAPTPELRGRITLTHVLLAALLVGGAAFYWNWSRKNDLAVCIAPIGDGQAAQLCLVGRGWSPDDARAAAMRALANEFVRRAR